MPALGAVLEVRIRRKAFRSAGGMTRPVLRDVHFAARAGESLALLGPSGTGKSTILRIILGLERDWEGTVRLPPGRVGVMFQEPRLLPWLSVEDNLRLVQPGDGPAADVPALLEEVLLPAARQLMPAALSLGMARRVALARALAVAPAMLVLDEPFASLDPALAGALADRIAARAARGGTLVVLSTHEPAQALAAASRVLVVAGQPATLLADLPVPDRADAAAARRLHQDMLERFGFLAGSGRADTSGHGQER